MLWLNHQLAQWAQQVRALDNNEFWGAIVVLSVLALLAFYGIFRFLFRARMIEDTPTSRIRSASQGYVELEGEGELLPGPPIVAPLSGRHCVWYSYRIEEREEQYGNSGRRSRWRTVESETSDSLFKLRDDTGECVIDPEGAEVTPSASDVWYGNSARWDHGLPSSHSGLGALFSTGRYRFSEKRVDVLEHLYVIGKFITIGGSQELPNTDADMRALLVSWKRDKAELLRRFDANGDGEIDMREWDAARKAARRQVLSEQSERFNAPSVSMVTKPLNARRPYIISVIAQDDLVRRFRRLAAGSLSGFLIFGAIAAWMLTVRVLGG